MSYKPILCVRTDARTDSDVNTHRRSAGMRTRLKGQAFDCVRLQTLNGTKFFFLLNVCTTRERSLHIFWGG
jgi:hypothetical protein